MPDAPPPSETPYAGLTPEAVLDALDAVGLRGDGRLIQLNSYENRVFQVFLEDGRVVVAKFYRPGRWSDAQILEEHAFAAELAAQEIPLAAPWPLQADTTSLHAEHLTRCGPTLSSFATPDGASALKSGQEGFAEVDAAVKSAGFADFREFVEVSAAIGLAVSVIAPDADACEDM